MKYIYSNDMRLERITWEYFQTNHFNRKFFIHLKKFIFIYVLIKWFFMIVNLVKFSRFICSFRSCEK